MLDVDYKTKSKEIIAWILKTVNDAGFTKVIIAVSGGVDSATSLFLAVQALGKENVYAVLLPYGELSKTSVKHGKLAVEKAGLPKDHMFVREIKDAVDVIANEVKQSQSGEQKTDNRRQTTDNTEKQKSVESASSVFRNPSSVLSHLSSEGDIRLGNIMARVRMIYLFDLAKSLSALVVGTENKSEHYLGYFTRFGDEASDIEPIRNLYKTQVWEVAKYLGVPKEIIGKPPSAGLWEGQSDEGEFGFSYAEADKVLHLAFDEGMRNGDIIKSGIDEKIVRKVMEFVDKNNFKHHVPKVME